MTRHIVLRREARDDLRQGHRWYEDRREGLGATFLHEVQAALNRAAQRPLEAPIVEDDARRVLVRRFPYAVFYLAEADRIVVLAVMHQGRHPRQ